MRNTAFVYVYQDAAGNVNPGVAVFAGVFSWKQKNRLSLAFESSEHFIASQIKVPEVFLWSADADYDPDDTDSLPAGLAPGKFVIGPQDHCWHQYVGLELVDADPTDDRTFEEFVADVELAASQGWDEFDPKARAPKAVRARLARIA